jgi:glycosyltransferase involved in cell wall biosynthesis
MGYNPIPGADIEWHDFCPVEEYMDKLYSLNLDIGICPLKDDMFNASKSNIKFLEYASCNVAVIASKVYPFDETIQEDRTGLIIANEKEWFEALKVMVIDASARKSIAELGRDYVKRYFTYKEHGASIEKAWQEIIDELY